MNKTAKKVMVALSGGVDSSVASILLKQQGYELMAVTLKTFCYQGEAGPKACCGLEGVAAAKAVAAKLAMPHLVLDVAESFQKEVIENFINEYAAGRTPNPCVRCNATVKIPYLLNKARSYGCEFLATGHYANLLKTDENQILLRRGTDKAKDQSYFLWEVPARVWPHMLLPCGSFTKSEIRKIAVENDLVNAKRPESQEICFVPDGDYMNFLRRHLPADHPGFQPGEIIGPQGKVIGTHNGYMNYTVGQRKGIGGGQGIRLYVKRIDPKKRQVLTGIRDDLFGSNLKVEKINSLIGNPAVNEKFMVQVRYKSQPVCCHLTAVAENHWEARLEEPVYAISPGQSAVFYKDDLLVSGGTICDVD
jgi:tRNA-specific 2-thiouridylase